MSFISPEFNYGYATPGVLHPTGGHVTLATSPSTRGYVATAIPPPNHSQMLGAVYPSSHNHVAPMPVISHYNLAQQQLYAHPLPQQPARVPVYHSSHIPQQQYALPEDNLLDVTAAGIFWAQTNADESWMPLFRSRVASTDKLTPRSSRGEIIVGRSLLARESQALSTMIALVRRRLNVLAPINRLPPEVLTYIFALLTDVDPPKRVSFSSGERIETVYYRRLGWIRVTHVCWSWREQALANFRLWTNIDAEHTAVWMNEVVLRSRQMPLTFSLDMDGYYPNRWNEARDAVELVLSPGVSSRLKQCYFKVCSGRMATLLNMLVNPAPLLEELQLRTNSPMDSPPDLGTIFASSMPRLRHLALEGFMPLSEHLPDLRNLTSLEIVNAHVISIASCLNVLTRSPLLESLVLKGIFKSPETTNYAQAPATLNRLSMLGLQGEITELTAFLRGLQVPATSAVGIDFSTSQKAPKGFLPLLAALLPLLAPFATPDIDRLIVNCKLADRKVQPPQRLSWAGYRGDATKLRIEGGLYMSTVSGALEAICAGLCADGVRGLGLDGERLGGISKAALLCALRSVPALERLALQGKGIGPVLKELGRPMRCKPALCPALAILEVGDACLIGGLGDTLLRTVQARRAAGVPVKTLALAQCLHAPELLEKLRACEVRTCVFHELVNTGEKNSKNLDDDEGGADDEDGNGSSFFV